MRRRGVQEAGEAVGHVFGMHGLEVETAAVRQGQDGQARQFEEGFAAAAAAPVYHGRACQDGVRAVFADGFVAAPFAADEGDRMCGVCAEGGELQPAGNARFPRPCRQFGGGVVVDGFEQVAAAAHDADAVGDGIAAFQQRHGGGCFGVQQVEFAVRRGADLVSGFAQAEGEAAADKAAAAEQQDVHGVFLVFFVVGRGVLEAV